MRKTYIQPTCEVVELKMQTSVLQASNVRSVQTTGLGDGENLNYGADGEESKYGDAEDEGM